MNFLSVCLPWYFTVLHCDPASPQSFSLWDMPDLNPYICLSLTVSLFVTNELTHLYILCYIIVNLTSEKMSASLARTPKVSYKVVGMRNCYLTVHNYEFFLKLRVRVYRYWVLIFSVHLLVCRPWVALTPSVPTFALLLFVNVEKYAMLTVLPSDLGSVDYALTCSDTSYCWCQMRGVWTMPLLVLILVTVTVRCGECRLCFTHSDTSYCWCQMWGVWTMLLHILLLVTVGVRCGECGLCHPVVTCFDTSYC